MLSEIAICIRWSLRYMANAEKSVSVKFVLKYTSDVASVFSLTIQKTLLSGISTGTLEQTSKEAFNCFALIYAQNSLVHGASKFANVLLHHTALECNSKFANVLLHLTALEFNSNLANVLLRTTALERSWKFVNVLLRLTALECNSKYAILSGERLLR